MGQIAVFVDAGYFWVQAVHTVCGEKASRDHVRIDYASMRSAVLQQVQEQFPSADLLRVYWYDGPGPKGKAASHLAIEDLDDFKLRLGTRNGFGDQKAVDGLIIADMIGLAQTRAISSALLVSGDADLTPGVIAAQALGIRVHLLSLGNKAATSPYLRAEVDSKSHWSDDTIRGFAQDGRQEVLSMLQTEPATSPKQNEIDTARMLVEAARVVLEHLEPALRGTLSPTKAIPGDIDKRLLRAARKRIGRALTDGERLDLRQELKRQLRAEPEA